MYFPSKKKHMGEFQILILDVNIQRHGLRESSFNMTSGGNEDIETRSLKF